MLSSSNKTPAPHGPRHRLQVSDRFPPSSHLKPRPCNDHLSWKGRPTALSIFWLTTRVNRINPGEMDLWHHTPRKKNVNQEVVECYRSLTCRPKCCFYFEIRPSTFFNCPFSFLGCSWTTFWFPALRMMSEQNSLHVNTVSAHRLTYCLYNEVWGHLCCFLECSVVLFYLWLMQLQMSVELSYFLTSHSQIFVSYSN